MSMEAQVYRDGWRDALAAVCEAYGGDPADATWSTPQGIAAEIERLSALAREYAAKWAAAEVVLDRTDAITQREMARRAEWDLAYIKANARNGWRGPMVLPTNPADHPWQMIVCEHCGNKRCPHAEWHGYACTGSNAPGQIGTPAATPNTPE